MSQGHDIMACMHGSSEHCSQGQWRRLGGPPVVHRADVCMCMCLGRACVEMGDNNNNNGWSYSAGSGRGRVVRAAWMMYAHLAATVRIAAIGPNGGGGKRGQLTCKGTTTPLLSAGCPLARSFASPASGSPALLHPGQDKRALGTWHHALCDAATQAVRLAGACSAWSLLGPAPAFCPLDIPGASNITTKRRCICSLKEFHIR